jgi:hypothetical protein
MQRLVADMVTCYCVYQLVCISAGPKSRSHRLKMKFNLITHSDVWRTQDDSKTKNVKISLGSTVEAVVGPTLNLM